MLSVTGCGSKVNVQCLRNTVVELSKFLMSNTFSNSGHSNETIDVQSLSRFHMRTCDIIIIFYFVE